jgi:hypothetical protein
MSSSPATTPACCSSAWKSASTATSRPSRPRTAPICARNTSSANIPSCSNWSRTRPTTARIHLHRGGHDPAKIYNAYKRAVEHKGGRPSSSPRPSRATASARRRRATHPLREEAHRRRLAAFVKRFDIPIPDKPPPKTERLLPPAAGLAPRSLHAGAPRRAWAAICPRAKFPPRTFKAPKLDFFKEWLAGSAAAPSPPPWASSTC